MPVFLAFVRGHDALEIGTIMLVTGIAQLLMAPVAVALEQRVNARLLTAAGFGLFAVGLGMSAFQTPETDFAGMFWPQVVRGLAIMFCLLPPTRLALGHLDAGRVPDASGVFNLMRNLGGAIGLALIDTVIYTRAPVHGAADRRAAAGGRHRRPPDLSASRSTCSLNRTAGPVDAGTIELCCDRSSKRRRWSRPSTMPGRWSRANRRGPALRPLARNPIPSGANHRLV